MKSDKHFLFPHPGFIAELATLSLFFLMLFVPFEQQLVKIGLIFVILISVFLLSLRSGIRLLHFDAVIWCAVLIGIGAFFVFWAILHGQMDGLKVMPVFVIYPCIYIFIIAAIARRTSLDALLRWLVNSSIIISAYSAMYMLSMVGILPSGIFILVKESVVSVGAEFFSYAMPSITSMLYLMPFILSALILWRDKDCMPVKRGRLAMALLLSLVPVIFSASRIFWILLLITPVLTYVFTFAITTKFSQTRRRIIRGNGWRLVLVIFVVSIFPMMYFWTELNDAFLSSNTFMDALTFADAGSSVRGEQLKMLLDGWSEVPLLGAGHGASLPWYKRSEDAPWAYELSFVALLYQTGIFGILAYFLAISWLFYASYKLCRIDAARSLYIIPVLVGLSCFLVATGTNPYLYAFDHLWTIFVPLIVLNVFMLQRDRRSILI
jgi:hypothetical protein